MQYSVKLTMLMKTQIGQALWRDAIPEEVTEADHANDIGRFGVENLSKKRSSVGKCFPVWRLINGSMLRRGSIILILRGLRGGSYFKSE